LKIKAQRSETVGLIASRKVSTKCNKPRNKLVINARTENPQVTF
jgi:hypothetical protein